MKFSRDREASSIPSPVSSLAMLTGAIVVPVLGFLWWSGLGLRPILVAVSVIAVQGAPGGYWWARAVRNRPTNAVEVIGMGLALGTLASLLVSQLLVGTWLASLGWLLPAAVTFTYAIARRVIDRRAVRSETGRRASPPGLDPLPVAALLSIPLLILGGLAIVVPLIRDSPLSWSGWWLFHKDFQFHEAVASSLHALGTSDSAWFAGESVKYHWFTHSWSGALSDTAALPPFAAITRFTYVVGVVGSAALAWSMGRSLSRTRWIPELAAGLVLLGTFVGVPLSIGLNVGAAAPAQAMATIWLLGATIALIRYLEGEVSTPSGLAFLALLSAGCVGGKVNHAAVFLGGMGLVALCSLDTSRCDIPRRRALLAAGAALIGAIAAFLYALVGSSGGGLVLEVNSAFAAATGLNPVGGAVGVALGMCAAVLAFGSRWVGLIWFLHDRTTRHRPEVVFASGVAISGLVLTFSLAQSGRSQDHFALSATAVLSVITAVAIGDVAERLARSGVGGAAARRQLGIAVLVGAVVGVGATATYYAANRGLLPSIAKFVAPSLLWIAACWVALGLVRRTGRSLRAAHGFLVVLVAGSIAAGALYPMQARVGANEDRRGGRADASTPNAWTMEYIDAARWLKENSNTHERVVTNRMCSAITQTPPNCQSRWYLGSGLTGRPFLVEGFSYGVEQAAGFLSEGIATPDLLTARVELSKAFTTDPSQEVLTELRENGVSWAWIDRNVPYSSRLEQFADLQFSNEQVEIYRLADES